MNELTILQSFRADREAEPAEAREAIRRALEARIEAAAAESRAFGEAVAGSTGTAATRPHRRRPGLFARRSRAFVLAAAALVAAVVVGALVLRSGPTATPASAAEILHEAARAAAASDAPATLVPGPGQYLFRKAHRLEVVGWLYPLPAAGAEGSRALMSTGSTMKGPDAFNALLPTTISGWTDKSAGGRHREVAGALRFWDKQEEARWKAAGSPLPSPFNAEYQRRYATAFGEPNEVGPGVIDTNTKGFGDFQFPETSKLPTEPKALRRAVEANAIEVSGFNLMFPRAERLDPQQTKEELLNVIVEGTPSAALQAAIFNALAELPGIEVETGAIDSLGREGDAIRSEVTEGIRSEYVFDPTTGEVIALRSVLVDPTASRFDELPVGTTISETDYIETAIVDSTNETGAGG